MTDFLLILGKLNVAIGAATIVVYLLRRPLRMLFGASVAYAFWVMVPIAGLAILLPPRVAASPPAQVASVRFIFEPMSLVKEIAQPAARMTPQAAEKIVRVQPMAAPHTASKFEMPDYATLLFAAWILGAALMTFYLTRLQIRFHAAVRSGEAGPAVLGFFLPRIVIPDTFREQFTASEQGAILAHERVHLARQDARINGLAALLRCLCWFNPLVHLGNAWLRIDQELACDAVTVAGSVSRRDYANALLKSQIMAAALPLGCNWPGSQHPLIERISLLKRTTPGKIRRMTGMGIVTLAATCGGLSAWAAQPPVTAKFAAGTQPAARIEAAPMALPAKSIRSKSTAAPELASAPNPDTNTAASLANQPAESPSAGPAPETDKAPATTDAAASAPSTFASRSISEQPSASDTAISNVPPTEPVESTPHAPVMTAQLTAQPQVPRPTCDLTSIANTAELEDVSGSDLMTVPVEINGKPKQFLLDIGTTPTEVSQNAVSELGLPDSTRSSSIVQSGGSGFSSGNVNAALLGQAQYPVYDVKGNQSAYAMRRRVSAAAFTVGGASTHNMPFMVATDGEIDKSAPYDGLLTSEIFRQYDVELDFAAKRISYLSPTKCLDPDQAVFWSHFEAAVIPISIVEGKIQVPVTVEGHPLQATIDTSSARSIMRRDIAELMLGYKAGTPSMMPAGELKDGMSQPVYVHSFSAISFSGGVTAVNVPVLIQSNGMLRDTAMVLGSRALSANARLPDFIIGMDVLRHLHLYFVWGQGKLYVTAAQ